MGRVYAKPRGDGMLMSVNAACAAFLMGTAAASDEPDNPLVGPQPATVTPGKRWTGGAGELSEKAGVTLPADPELEKVDPGQGARQASLVGAGNCSWTTSMMAARALVDGVPYTYVGHLEASDNDLSSHVATPYTVGPDQAIHVVANEVLGLMERRRLLTDRLDLRGRIIEVDGVRYLVITDFARVGA